MLNREVAALGIATKTYEKWRTKESGVEMPTDIRVDSLSDYQLADLRRLKDWIYQRRAQVRLDRDRGESRQKREGAEAAKKAEQPALFTF